MFGLLATISLSNAALKVRFECLRHIRQFPLHGTVPVVLYGVVGATVEHFGDIGPLIIELSMHKEKDPLFFATPVDFLYARVQMIVPAFSTLFTHAARQMFCDRCPALWSMLLNELQHFPVLFFSPRSFYELNATFLLN